MKTFKQQYRDLEMQVHRALRDAIENSPYESEHVQSKCIYVSISYYEELAIINDKITFIDADGQHYDIRCDCKLEDLIFTLDNHNNNKLKQPLM